MLVTVDEVLLPKVTPSKLGVALIAKLPAAGVEVTISVTGIDFTLLPLVPLMVIGYVPGAVDAPTFNVNAEEPLPLMDVGLKVAVTPVGRPVADKVTAELKPPVTVLVIVVLPLFPTRTVSELCEAEMEKPLVLTGTRALSNAGPFILPQPVTRS